MEEMSSPSQLPPTGQEAEVAADQKEVKKTWFEKARWAIYAVICFTIGWLIFGGFNGNDYVAKSKVSEAVSLLTRASLNVSIYFDDHGKFPATLVIAGFVQDIPRSLSLALNPDTGEIIGTFVF